MKPEEISRKDAGHPEHRLTRIPFSRWELVILGIALGIILISPVLLFAETEFFGYFESEYDGASIYDEHMHYGYSKLRIDMISRRGDHVTIGANLSGQLFYGEDDVDFLDFLPDPVREGIDAEAFPIEFEDSLELENAYLKLSFTHFDVITGKQPISLGTGYAWNPLDIFNRKDLIDPTYEQDGITAVRVEVPITERFFADLIVSPDEDWDSTEKFARMKLGIGSFDLIASAGMFRWDLDRITFPDFEVTTDSTDRIMIGGATVGEIWEIGIWAEGAWNILRDDSGDFEEFVVGIDHTFDFETYLLAEYYHNGSGENDQEDITFIHYYHLLTGGTHSLMRDYLFLFARHPATDLISVGLLGFGNLNDASFAVNPQVEWSAFEDVSVSAIYSHFFGDDDTEFGKSDWGVRLRLRAYF